MKWIFLTWVLCFGLNLHAQNAAELKPMIKQIALLKTYIAWIEKGYAIARKGLNTISDIKNKHWTLDTGFFNSIKRVNPKVSHYAKVAAIIDCQLEIAKACGRLKKQAFNNDELDYINAVTGYLTDQCRIAANQLAIVLSDQQLQMSDDERIKNIDTIYRDTIDQYGFIRNFSSQASILLLQRRREENDIHGSEKMNGL